MPRAELSILRSFSPPSGPRGAGRRKTRRFGFSWQQTEGRRGRRAAESSLWSPHHCVPRAVPRLSVSATVGSCWIRPTAPRLERLRTRNPGLGLILTICAGVVGSDWWWVVVVVGARWWQGGVALVFLAWAGKMTISHGFCSSILTLIINYRVPN